MKYEVIDIKKDVRISLDENSVGASLLDSLDCDALALDEIIEAKIVDAVRSVTAYSPSSLLDGGTDFAQTIMWGNGAIGEGMGYTLLPDDFMRLIVFQMNDWKRPVTLAIEDTDPKYFVQKSKFSGIRGGTEKPVCAITTYPEGKVLEFYSCTGGGAVKVRVAKYIPYPQIVGGQIDICKKLYTSSIYYTAGLVCATLKDKGQSEILFTLAKDYLK